ncbi:MAG: hypothetical protein JXR97_04370 [Planctomycetes bacterium]|nr:hypothetical protein [Planctomycetota bacterium]
MCKLNCVAVSGLCQPKGFNYTMIVISKSNTPTPAQSLLEGKLVKLLSTNHSLLILPEIYFLTPDHPAIKRLKNTKFSAFASWHFPRAAKWILEYLGISTSEPDIINLSCAINFADAKLSSLFSGIDPSDNPETVDLYTICKTHWYPVIDYGRCVDCGKCSEFCLFGVYKRDKDKVSVARPQMCKPGCPACARLCPKGAIIFPHCETDDGIAGDSEVEIKSGDIESARSFARENIAAYNKGKEEKIADSDNSQDDIAGKDPIDSLIDELEDLE